MSDELIDIATVVERDTVRIRTKKNQEGKLYELLNIDELGPYEYQVIVNAHAKVQKFGALKRKPTAAQERELDKALADILKLLIPSLEPRVLAEMESTPRARIVTAWSMKNSADVGDSPGEAAAGSTTAV